MSKDREAEILAGLEQTTRELGEAKLVVRDLANELADATEVIEPALAAHLDLLRRRRMAITDELRQIAAATKEVRELLATAPVTEMVTNAERFLAVCRELEEFRAVGFLDAFVELFVKTTNASPRTH